MSDKAAAERRGDKLASAISTYIFEDLTEKIQSLGSWRFEVDGFRPNLQFAREPDMWPIFVDLGDDRYTIECDVFVHRVVKDGPEDQSCTEAEAFPELS